jgi:hypothetical protein
LFAKGLQHAEKIAVASHLASQLLTLTDCVADHICLLALLPGNLYLQQHLHSLMQEVSRTKRQVFNQFDANVSREKNLWLDMLLSLSERSERLCQ